MRGRFPVVVLIVFVGGFAVGLWHLLQLRFEAGDVYPAYSSLRADPLGTMAFYESLGRLPGISVERDYSTHGRLPDGRGCAYFHLAAQKNEWGFLPEELVKEIEGFMLRGGRLVIGFLPVTHGIPESATNEEKAATKEQAPGKDKPTAKRKKTGKKGDTSKKEPGSREPDEFMRRVNVQDRWHFELGLIPLNTPEGQSSQPARVVARSNLPLPETLAWHSGLILTNVGSGWENIYARGKHPVVAERKFGAGSMVVATDCYLLSNEALRSERRTELLTWLTGGASRIVFDEAHLGITEGTGVAVLIGRYRLMWVAMVLGVLALLFIWKNSASFIPVPETAPGEEPVTGKQAASGFVSLLRRNIAARDVVAVCYSEWRKWALMRKEADLVGRVRDAEALLAKEKNAPDSARDPVTLYQSLSRILNQRTKEPPTNKT